MLENRFRFPRRMTLLNVVGLACLFAAFNTIGETMKGGISNSSLFLSGGFVESIIRRQTAGRSYFYCQAASKVICIHTASRWHLSFVPMMFPASFQGSKGTTISNGVSCYSMSKRTYSERRSIHLDKKPKNGNNQQSRRKVYSSSPSSSTPGTGRIASRRSQASPLSSTTRKRSLHSSATKSSTNGSRSSMRQAAAPPLEEPTIIYQNNHVLVVNKPAGWHSVPNDTRDFGSSTNTNNNKCLLTKLKQLQLGGGSRHDFLLPMHRLDQPCTGTLIFAKNKKAGTRITTAWKKLQVKKEYWCIVHGNVKQMKSMSYQSSKSHDNTFSNARTTYRYSIDGLLRRVSSSNSRSVVVSPIPTKYRRDMLEKDMSNTINLKQGERLCHLDWDLIETIKDNNNNLHLIKVQTTTGARHQVRAMLAQILHSPIAGDVRYSSNNEEGPLDDQSVALHARSVFLPTVKLGGMEFLSTKPFVSPIPSSWKGMFDLDERQFSSPKVVKS